jgi:hypothetical protein
MRSVNSAKRWISVFANVQETAIINARNVMSTLLLYLESQEGRMTSQGRHSGKLCPAYVHPRTTSQIPGTRPGALTGMVQDRSTIHSW